MKNLKKYKKVYDDIEIPKTYDAFIDECIIKAKKKTTFSFFTMMKFALPTTILVYLLCLNTIPTFAKTVFKMPLIGEISKVLCIRGYDEVNDFKEIHIKVPTLQKTGNSELENRINTQIQKRVDLAVQETEEEAKVLQKEYQKLYKDSKTMGPANVYIDYQVHHSSSSVLSFVITKTKAYNTSSIETFVYNLDMKTGQDITLSTLLGASFKETVNPQIEKQIQDRIQNKKNVFYFDDENKFISISDEQKFYIDKNGHIVIIFDKYEIAPGYMGVQEFILDNKY